LRVTAAGRFEGPVQIATTPAEAAVLWQQLPAMNWVRTGIYPAPHADTLVVTDGEPAASVLVTALAGLGKTVYLGTDSFWRWRRQAGWKYHHRLWGQILLWAGQERTAGAGALVKIMAERNAYAPGEDVILKARIITPDRRPLIQGHAAADILTANGDRVRTVPFEYLPASGGEYRAQVTDLPRGRFAVVPRVVELPMAEPQVACEFDVTDVATSELIELQLNQAALRNLADEYRHFMDCEDLVAAIP